MTRGYTLIELLVVISVISVVTIIGFVDYKNFSSDQIAIKALGQVQTYLRLAQTNATSSTFCDSTKQNIGPWSLIFTTDASLVNNTILLSCGPLNTTQATLTLENAEVSQILGSDCLGSASGLPFTVSFGISGTGSLTFSNSSSTSACLLSSTWTFTLRNRKDNSKTQVFKLSKGGAINLP